MLYPWTDFITYCWTVPACIWFSPSNNRTVIFKSCNCVMIIYLTIWVTMILNTCILISSKSSYIFYISISKRFRIRSICILDSICIVSTAWIVITNFYYWAPIDSCGKIYLYGWTIYNARWYRGIFSIWVTCFSAVKSYRKLTRRWKIIMKSFAKEKNYFCAIFIVLSIYSVILFNLIFINMSIFYINSEIKELLMSSQKIKNK